MMHLSAHFFSFPDLLHHNVFKEGSKSATGDSGTECSSEVSVVSSEEGERGTDTDVLVANLLHATLKDACTEAGALSSCDLRNTPSPLSQGSTSEASAGGGIHDGAASSGNASLPSTPMVKSSFVLCDLDLSPGTMAPMYIPRWESCILGEVGVKLRKSFLSVAAIASFYRVCARSNSSSTFCNPFFFSLSHGHPHPIWHN